MTIVITGPDGGCTAHGRWLDGELLVDLDDLVHVFPHDRSGEMTRDAIVAAIQAGLNSVDINGRKLVWELS